MNAPDFRTVLDALPEPCLLLLPDGPDYQIVARNLAWSELFPGETEREALSAEAASAVRKMGDRCWRPVNSPLPGADGSVRFLLHRLGEVTPENLPEPEERYRLAFARAPIGMVLVTPDGRIKEVNQAYLDCLGYTREELNARDSSFFTHPDDIELTRNFFRWLQEDSRGTGSIEKRYIRKDRGILWARASGTLRRDHYGKPVEVVAIVEDITKRKLAEQKLWESQAQLRAIYDGTYEYIGLLSLDGTVLDCNRASLEFAGNPREDVIGKPFWQTPWFTATPGASETVRQGVSQAAKGQFVRYEAALRRPSGETITFDFSIHPVRNERGEVAFLVPEGRDITERNRAAQQIEEDRRRWRDLLKQTPAAIALLRGPEHRFDWVNPEYEALTGRSGQQLIGRTVLEAFPEIAGQAYLDLLNGVYRRAEPYHGHESPLRLNQKDGAVADLYVNFVYLPTRNNKGETDGIFVHVTDVTGAVLARKRVEESERRFRQLADSMPQMVWTTLPDGYIDYYNERWYDFTGFDRLAEPNQNWLPLVHPDDLERVQELWAGSLRTGEPFQIEARMWDRAENRWRWIMGRAVSVRDETGRIVKWFGTGTDIDEQKTSQQALLQTQKLESIGLLAGGIAHDFNNLLVGIMGGASFALETLPASHPAFDMLRTVVEASERAAHLTRQMLAYAGKGNFIIAPVDLSQMVIQTAQLVSASIPKSVQVSLGLADDLPIVEADPGQIQQIVMNLIINAAEAVGEKPGLVGVRTRAEAITEANACRGMDGLTLSPGTYAVLEVEDTGSGIEQSILTRIFDPFFSTKFTGRGLGLAAVAGVIRSHHGAIEVETEPGKGSTFRVLLPATRKERPGVSAPVADGAAQTGRETILVIDDEALVRRVARAALGEYGYRVIETAGSVEGLEQIRANGDISLVLLDMSMPGASGREVLESLREIRPTLPVVICSGYSEGEVHRHFSGMEISGVLQKPFTARSLTTRIRAILDSVG